VAQICKASQLAFYVIKRSRRIGLIPSAESPLPTFDLNVFAQVLCAANTCWCWLTCPHSALHSPIRSASKRQLILKRTMTLTPNRIDTRISLRCQVVVLFHRAACVERGNCPTTNDNLDIWFLVILLQLLCSALIQLIETTQLLRLVFYA